MCGLFLAGARPSCACFGQLTVYRTITPGGSHTPVIATFVGSLITLVPVTVDGMRLFAAAAALVLVLIACSSGSTLPGAGSSASTSMASVTERDTSTQAIPSGTENWLKGQLHMHTSFSPDSSTSPKDMIERYEELGFDFIVITDHNQTTNLTEYDGEIRAYVGVELSQGLDACDPQPLGPEDKVGWCHIHVSSLFSDTVPPDGLPWGPFRSGSPLGLSEFLIITAQQLGGLTMINHPDQYGAVTGSLLVEQWLRGAALVEIANMSTKESVVPLGHPHPEEIWDEALSTGAYLLGVASDDAHRPSEAGFGWVMVRADNTEESIRRALAAGDFYSSTGVVLSRLDVTATHLTIEVDGVELHTIDFIGRGGHVLWSTEGTSAAIELPADGYVRAVITASDDAKAWTQPASLPQRAPSG